MVDFNEMMIYSKKRVRIIILSGCQEEAMVEALREMSHKEIDILEKFFEEYSKYRKWRL